MACMVNGRYIKNLTYYVELLCKNINSYINLFASYKSILFTNASSHAGREFKFRRAQISFI